MPEAAQALQRAGDRLESRLTAVRLLLNDSGKTLGQVMAMLESAGVEDLIRFDPQIMLTHLREPLRCAQEELHRL
ncbi:hypothetical protein [uncultured Aquitalea sp.]|uniref:hypothetical protein n=1 Tax=uncultured Aquitalea sp. TaxID=540272 RepID=UPI0025E54DA2|nr:hypothetical protein [uncultured Aquitalea sp.]